jgi:GldM third domain/Gram-negative bacterial TonB protein C-terminal
MRVMLFFLFLFISTKLLSQTSDPPPPVDSVVIGNGVFEKVDVEATFSGGDRAWRKYLEQNLNPNVPVENGAPVGIYTVIVQFIVDKSGAVSDIKTLTNFGYGMEQEVIRIMKKSPMWTPASQNNSTVKAYRKQPITFVLEDEAVEIIMNEKYVLYTGTDNIIKISVSKVKKEDLELSLSQGKIILGNDGNFHINVNNPGKAILYINSRKRNKEISSVYFVVKKKT